VSIESENDLEGLRCAGRIRLTQGLVIALEPIISAGAQHTRTAADPAPRQARSGPASASAMASYSW